MRTIGLGFLRGVLVLPLGIVSRLRSAANEFGLEGRNIKTETELIREGVLIVLQNGWVPGIGSQTMNSVSGVKQSRVW